MQILEKTKDFEKSTKVYLDHNATTPVAEVVLSDLAVIAGIWGNPSSIHWAGRGPKGLLRDARKNIAEILGGVSPLELIFTSGGTEANTSVIKSVFDAQTRAKSGEALFVRNEYITSSVEHPSVIRNFEWIAERGTKVHFVPVNRQGELDMDFYQSCLNNKTALVSIMMANNETGIVYPTQKLAKMAHQVGAYFHCDAVQALGKISLNLHQLDVDYASFSAHKIYALKGTGVLYVKKSSPMESLIAGGGQERHRRGGTENTLGIWAMGQMAKDLSTEGRSVSDLYPKIQELRDYFEQKVLSEISEVSINGNGLPRLPNTSSLILNGVDGEVLLMSLDLLGFAVSTGAACSSGNPEPSPVLLSMGLTRVEAQHSLRVSIGRDTSKDQIDRFISSLKTTVQRLRDIEQQEISEQLRGSYV